MAKMTINLDDETERILRRAVGAGVLAEYVRVAIIEKATRDELRRELDAVISRVEHIERWFGIGADSE